MHTSNVPRLLRFPPLLGGRPVSHMIRQRFEGGVYPVNPNRDTIQGLKAYPSLAAIDGDVDFVLVAVPAAGVAEIVRQAAAKRAKTVMVRPPALPKSAAKALRCRMS